MLRIVLAALLTLAVVAPVAAADVLVYRDPNTCAETTVAGVTITSETWQEVRYREGKRGPDKGIPTALVTDIRRDDKGAQARALLSAIGELERGKTKEALVSLKPLAGGGWAQDEQGRRVFKSFAANDPAKKRKRPSWTSEYAHFYYLKGLVLEALKGSDEELLNEAWLSLVEQPAPGGEDGATTGGFLHRFKDGNSRFYAEAMLLKAKVLQAQKKMPQAVKAYRDLEAKAAALDIGPQWAYESKIGPAYVAEAQGKYMDAINLAGDASTVMRIALKDEGRDCFRKALGRYFSRGRMEQVRIRLQQAEKDRSPAQFQQLRTLINSSSPEALKRSFSVLPAAQLTALVDGAMDPKVQAVMKNGLGLAYLSEKKYEEAIHAFRAVEVRYFEDVDQHARALHYLTVAAEGAAQKASGEAKKLYERLATGAKARLEAEHPHYRPAQED